MPSRPRPTNDVFRDDDDDLYDDFSRSSTPNNQAARSSPKLGNNSNASSARASPKPQPSLSRAQQFKMRGGDNDDIGTYVSSARHRRRDLQSPLDSGRSSPSSNAAAKEPFVSQIRTKPKPPSRAPVAISSTALDMASTSRTSGTDAFKRGDYTQAEIFYTQALQSVPETHLLRTIVLSNRSAAYMKLGDSKSALKDSSEGIDLIGPGMGAEEFAEPGKPLKEIWSKLVQRKAEALEALESSGLFGSMELAHRKWILFKGFS